MSPNEAEFQGTVTGMKLSGEIITWNAKGSRKHSQVTQALASAGLDKDVAHEFQPRAAFSRAIKQLSDGRIVEVIRESPEEVLFQFTKSIMDNLGEEWVYKTEAKVTLNKRTGEIFCDNTTLRELAQKKLDECMVERTSSDITKIVQKLFEKEADLFAIRDQGGVYFVPANFVQFTNRIEKFLGDVGGYIRRFPVPSGTELGDKSVQEAISESLSTLINEHVAAVKSFDLDTRHDTFARMVDTIKNTRTKIEAYAEHLKDQAKVLLDAVDDAKRMLSTRAQSVTQERQMIPPGERVNHQFIFNYSATSVIRWMGKNNWSFADAKKVVGHYTNDSIAEATVRAQLLGGRNGQRGEPAPLTAEQIEELNTKRSELE